MGSDADDGCVESCAWTFPCPLFPVTSPIHRSPIALLPIPLGPPSPSPSSVLSILNLPVARIYAVNGVAFSSFPNIFAYSLSFWFFPASSAHLSCTYFGQSRTKCCVDSMSCPHAGQFGWAILLNLCRYSFSGMCPTLNWKSQLTPCLEMSGPLVSFRKFNHGTEESICLVLCVRGDLHQFFLHSFLSFILCSCFAADLLCFRGFLSTFGNKVFSVVFPSAAFLASLSASSFPSMLTCPAVQPILSE